MPGFGGTPTLVGRTLGNDDFNSEKLTAFELGYRLQLNESSSIDLAAFHNRYSDVSSFEVTAFGDIINPNNPPATLSIPSTRAFSNKREVTSQGLEMVYDWHPAQHWKLQAAYAYIQLDDDTGTDSSDPLSRAFIEGATPENQLSLRLSHDFSPSLALDTWLYYIDELAQSAQSQASRVADYTSINVRLGWQARKNLELSLVGQNLGDERHGEFVGENLVTRSELERAAYLQLRMDF